MCGWLRSACREGWSQCRYAVLQLCQVRVKVLTPKVPNPSDAMWTIEAGADRIASKVSFESLRELRLVRCPRTVFRAFRLWLEHSPACCGDWPFWPCCLARPSMLADACRIRLSATKAFAKATLTLQRSRRRGLDFFLESIVGTKCW